MADPNARTAHPRRYASPKDGHDSYCAPWCGFHCHHAAFEQATREAAELAALMGAGWEPRVWENCGWNYDVCNGLAEVHVIRNGSGWQGGWTVSGYSGWLQSRPQHIASGPFLDPREAIDAALTMARESRDKLSRAIQEFA